MAEVFRRGEEYAKLGYEGLVNSCFIVSGDGEYLEIHNRYLAERAKLLYHPNPEFVAAYQMILGRKPRYPRPNSNLAMAHDLANMQSWCEDIDMHRQMPASPGSKLEWRELSCDDLLEYREDMEQGAWSQDGRPLAASTINRRLMNNLHFLNFGAVRGYRTKIYDNANGGDNDLWDREQQRLGRSGRDPGRKLDLTRRVDPVHLTPPSRQEIYGFIEKTRDPAQKLAKKLIFQCGLRVHEVAELPIDAIPTLKAVQASHGRIGVRVEFPVIGKGNRKRMASIPGELVAEIDEWRRELRILRLGRYCKIHGIRRNDPDAPQTLLLNADDGSSLSINAIRKLWREERTIPGLSPHIGRHCAAVYWLLDRLEIEARRMKLAVDSLPAGFINDALSSHLLVLKERLGHARLESTERYLVMLRKLLDLDEPAILYNEMLDREEGDG